ncbi:MAG TPA: CFI-box-CTERM domain-containing protein [Polyangia bacterium]|jgi:hypothetical protein
MVVAVLCWAGASRAAEERALVLTFTPTDRAQVAIWVESADGTFLATVGLTQAVSVRGIGNRPGAAQMNSGYHWPYGRREGVLPVWAHRRAAAPGAVQFPRVVFQDRKEGYASQTCADSTKDPYFCLSFQQESTTRDGLDAVTCASPSAFNSDKGRILTAADVSDGYAEPVALSGPPIWQFAERPLSLTSVYPPRRDFTSCADSTTVSACLGGGNGCHDHPDSARYSDLARTAMPEIDAVTMATPPGGMEQNVMFSVPASWPDGNYVAYLEVNVEGDYDAAFNPDSDPTPCSPWANCGRSDLWDYWAVTFGYPYRGQPSVVFAVPFVLGPAAQFSTMTPVGFGSLDGTDADPGAMHVMDASIADDPQGAAGSGADRLRMGATQTSRLELEVRPCLANAPSEAPTGLTVAPVADPKHSHEWAHLHFVVPGNQAEISRYEVRTSTDPHPIVAGDDTSFIQGLPAQAASSKTEALVIPVGQPSGAAVDVDLGGLRPLTHYWVGVRAVDDCNRPGPHAVAEVTTTKINFTQLPPISLNPAHPQCFIATAAWGSTMEPAVRAMRHARDRLLVEVPLFSVAADLYGRSGPPAAALLRRSDAARTLARQLLGPLGTAAEAVVP